MNKGKAYANKKREKSCGDMDYTGKPTVEVLDVQEYAKLGG